jgi:N-acetylglucosamine-6-sulfatase
MQLPSCRSKDGGRITRAPRNRSLLAAATAVFVLVEVLSPAGAVPTRATSARPNIVVINFDDAVKSDVETMPNVKALIGDQGTTFDRFYATESLCCPSRATLLLGEYVHNHQIYSNRPPHGGYGKFKKLGHEQRTIAAQLHELGYETSLFGKYMNGYGTRKSRLTYVPPFWSNWFGLRSRDGYYRYSVSNNGKIMYFGHSRKTYVDAVIGRQTIEWVGQPRDKPFLAYVAPRAPHSPYTDPPDHRRDYKKLQPPSMEKPSYNEQDVRDKPRYVRRKHKLSRGKQKGIGSLFRHRLRMMRATDDFIGTLVAQLRATGQLDNTYIFVTSDNGWMQGEHRIALQKVCSYEESVNLPLLVRGPGITPGSRISGLASMADLFATFTDLGGGTEQRDGRSLMPLMRGDTSGWRRQLLIENFDTINPVPKFFGLVTDRYKFVEYATGELELYDLVNDPYEIQNVAGSAPLSLMFKLKRKLDELSVCAGDTCRTADTR